MNGLQILGLVFVPACAVAAGLLTWVIVRGDKTLQDGRLVANFMLVFGLLAGVSYAIAQSQAVQQRFNPAVKASTAMAAQPVIAALQQHLPYQWKPLEERALQAAAAKVPLPEILAELRTSYLPLTRRHLPFARAEATLAYANAVVPALRELQAQDPRLCLRLAWQSAGPPFDVGAQLSPAVASAYEAAVARVLSENSLTVLADSKQVRPADPPESHASPEVSYAAYRAIVDRLQPRFGPVADKLRTAEVASLDPALACNATIALLEQSLAQPPAVARSLASNFLRD